MLTIIHTITTLSLVFCVFLVSILTFFGAVSGNTPKNTPTSTPTLPSPQLKW